MKTKMTFFLFLSCLMLSSPLVFGDYLSFVEYIDAPFLLQSIIKSTNARYETLWNYGVVFSCIDKRTAQNKGNVTIGVFKDVKEASDIYNRKLRSFSSLAGAKFNANIGNERAINDNWVFFRRDNVVVEVSIHEQENERIAESLDKSLISGKDGVRRGNTIIVPIIKRYEFGTKGIIVFTEPSLQGYSSWIDRNGHPTRDNNSIDSISFATKGCVMAKPFKCDAETLKQILAIEQARKNEGTKLNEAEFRRQVEILESPASGFEARKDAILILANSNDERAVPVLMAEIDRLDKTAEPFVLRCLAIRGLGMLRSQKAVARLGDFLLKPPKGNVNAEDEDSEAIDRREAINSLWLIGGEAARIAIGEVSRNTKEYRSVKQFAEAKLKTMK